MQLQVCFVDPVAQQASWLNFEPEDRLPATEHPDEILQVVRRIMLPEGMTGLRVLTSKEVWTFQWHPTFGCVPRLVDESGEVVEVWPTNAEVGGIWEIQHVLPDGNLIPMMYVEPDPSFTMGDDESPSRRKVSVTGGFMAKYPTTVREWNWFAKATGKPLKPTRVTDKNGLVVDLSYHPVTEVSYWDAVEFASWAGVGIPTEEQWEHAARGRDGRKFPWGNTPPTDEVCHSSIKTQQERTDDVRNRPKGASPFGVEELSGNCWEWTSTVHK